MARTARYGIVKVIRIVARVLALSYGLLLMFNSIVTGSIVLSAVIIAAVAAIMVVACKLSRRSTELAGGGLLIAIGLGFVVYDSVVRPPLGSGDLFWSLSAIVIGILLVLTSIGLVGQGQILKRA